MCVAPSATTCPYKTAIPVNKQVQQWKQQFMLWSNIDSKEVSCFTSDTKSDNIGSILISTYSMIACKKRSERSSEMPSAEDEDSWLVIGADNYDNRGEIYRAGLLNSLYHYALQYNLTRGQVYFDLSSGHYVVSRLSNKTGQAKVVAEMKKPEFYTPSNLRRQGRR